MASPTRNRRWIHAASLISLTAALAAGPVGAAVAAPTISPRIAVTATAPAAHAGAVAATAASRLAAARSAAAHRAALKRAAARKAAAHRAAPKRAAARKAAAHRAALKRAAAAKKAAAAKAAAAKAAAAAQAAAVGVPLTPFEARMVTLVNGARAQHGLPALTVAAGATDVARRWCVQLAKDDALSHNPSLVNDLQSSGAAHWTFLAENVGTGPAGDADGLFAAYMASEHHRDNILDPRARVIGMAALAASETDGPAEWNVMDFEDGYSASSYGAARTHPVAQVLPVAALAGAVGG